MSIKRPFIVLLLLALSLATVGRAQEIITLGALEVISGSPDGEGGDVGQYAEFIHDDLGGQHIAYFDDTNNRLKYAHRAAPSMPWTVDVVDDDGDVGLYASLDVGDVQETTATLIVTSGSTTLHRSGGAIPSTWVGGEISLPPYTNWFRIREKTGLTVAELETPYTGTSQTGLARIQFYQPVISYQDFTVNRSLKVARPGGDGSWILETVDSVDFSDDTTATLLVGYHTATGIDRFGDIHVAYQDLTPDGTPQGELRHARFDGTEWTREIVDALPGAGYESKIAFENSDVIYIFHRNEEQEVVRISQKTLQSEFGWTSGWAVDGADTGRGLDLTHFEAGNTFFLSYWRQRDGLNQPDRIAAPSAKPGVGWFEDEVLQGENIGAYTSIAHGPTTDTQMVTFYDQGNRQLMGARYETDAYLPPVWLDRDADVGQYCSADRSPTVSDLFTAYYDAENGALKMARWDGTTTQTQFVDGIEAGTWSQIGATSTEVICAYYNDTQGSLRVARWPLGGIPADGTDEVVDNSSLQVGEYVSMAIDSADRIYLAYYDATGEQMKIAVYHNGRWFTVPFGLNGGTIVNGDFCRIAINPDEDEIGVVFRNADLGIVIAATSPLQGPNPILNFAFSTVYTSGATEGKFCSLTFDTTLDSDLHLAYYDESNLRVQYVLISSTGVYEETIEESPYDVVGYYTDIFYNPNNFYPEVVYQAVSESALRHAAKTAGWNVETLDSDEATGFAPRIVYDPDNLIEYVVYYNNTREELRILWRSVFVSEWSGPYVYSGQSAGYRPSGAVEPGGSGRLLLSFHDLDSGNLLTTASIGPPAERNSARPAWLRYE